jgi:penicillin-binding protein 1A
VRGTAAIGVAAAALVLAACLYELSLPGVGNAQARVSAILHAHHDEMGHLPLPTKLSEAVVAVEDKHFYSNTVVDVFDGAARAALAVLNSSSTDPGGSTISQQLAKELYGKGRGVGATLQEIGLGVKLSLTYSRPQVLEMYLNVVYYGNGYWGDEAAAEGYFRTNPYNLSWAEAAMLAGLPNAPSAYDPVYHFKLAKERQQHVLDRLVADHVITAAQAAAAYRAPVPLRRS